MTFIDVVRTMRCIHCLVDKPHTKEFFSSEKKARGGIGRCCMECRRARVILWRTGVMHGRRSLPERFRYFVQVAGDLDCWLWLGGKLKGGYGVFSLKRGERFELAHRVAYALAHDLDPRSLGGVVMHSCDNPPCVNPAHLRLGTQRDNIHDMIAKGRYKAVNQ